MDVELMCLMRHLRRSGRSAWGRGHPREKPGVDGGFSVSAGKLERPGRCVNTVDPRPNHRKGVADAAV